MFTNYDNLNPKNKTYSCEKCDFITRNKKDYGRHIATPKHKNNTYVDDMSTETPNINPKLPKTYACECGKTYNSRQGIHTHKKKCKIINTIPTIEKSVNNTEVSLNEKTDMCELVKILIKENSELKNMMIEQQNLVLEIVKNGTHNTINNNNCNNNQTFNLQLFLNETCKDAMNIMDFIESINLKLSDLESVGHLGYVKGISNIIVNKLKALDVTQRPVHCSDAKREILYIKDNNVWEKQDSENTQLKKAVKYISHKNILLLPQWREKYPDCIEYDSPKNDFYSKMRIEAMGGDGSTDEIKMSKIIRNIAKEVVIEK
jgi:hypothetical protein